MRELLELIITFMKIGSVTFGGGYAMLPILEREIVNKKKWCTTEEIMDYFAIGQCTPGIIFVNTATFIGFKKKGILGGICATLGSIIPSIIIILSIATVISNFSEIEWINNAFNGISIMVAVLIVNAVITMGKKSITKCFYLMLAVLAYVLSEFIGISTVFIIILFICYAIVHQYFIEKKVENGDKK